MDLVGKIIKVESESFDLETISDITIRITTRHSWDKPNRLPFGLRSEASVRVELVEAQHGTE